MRAFLPACAAALLLAAAPAPCRAGPITQIVSFGDSLSDVGNSYAQYGYPASPPYAAGRYSNGPIWLDRLASQLGVAAPKASLNGGLDYAVGGAATDTPAISPAAGFAPLVSPALKVIGLVPNVNTQIASYLSNYKPAADTLYTLWAGANDFFDGQTDPRKPADNLTAEILTLINKGAKNFLVANLPPLGDTPLARAEGPAARMGLNALTVNFNLELYNDLSQIQAAHPDVKLNQFSTFGLFLSAEGDPSAFGLTNVTDPAILAPGADADSYLFWDDVHPTAAAGRIIGDAAFALEAKGKAPEPSSVVLILAGGAGLLGWRLRRKRPWRLPAAVGALLAGVLLIRAEPCPAQTPSPSSPADAAAGTDAGPAAPGDVLTPAPPLLRHFKLDESWLPGLGRNGLAIDDVEAGATLAAPLVEGLDPLLLTPGAGLHFWKGPGRGAAAAPPDLPASLYDAYLEIGWQPHLAEWLFADLAVTPGAYSDFRDVNAESFQMRGRGLAIVAFSPQLQVVAGALYVNFNHTKLLPAGGVVWNPDDDTRLQLLFPRPKLARRVEAWGGGRWWAYLAGEFGGGRWSVERTGGAADSLDYTDVRALLGLECLAPDGPGGHVEVGYVFDRRVTFTGDTPDYRPGGTLLLRAGVKY